MFCPDHLISIHIPNHLSKTLWMRMMVFSLYLSSSLTSSNHPGESPTGCIVANSKGQAGKLTIKRWISFIHSSSSSIMFDMWTSSQNDLAFNPLFSALWSESGLNCETLSRRCGCYTMNLNYEHYIPKDSWEWTKGFNVTTCNVLDLSLFDVPYQIYQSCSLSLILRGFISVMEGIGTSIQISKTQYIFIYEDF